ncbi:MAG: MarR family transcriptional regulator [Lachnospiraceae bacterium]|nr:MarR family transcriptional regulator [Lachnospiraceae bacterium]
MNQLQEKLLSSWVRLSTAVVNNRVVTNMSYNESLVCHVLYENSVAEKPLEITATDLCEATHILKSQMNRILTSLESKNIITRIRSLKDKRQINIALNMDQAGLFKTQHEHIIKLIDTIIERIGIDTAKDAIRIFDTISDTADELLH